MQLPTETPYVEALLRRLEAHRAAAATVAASEPRHTRMRELSDVLGQAIAFIGATGYDRRLLDRWTIAAASVTTSGRVPFRAHDPEGWARAQAAEVLTATNDYREVVAALRKAIERHHLGLGGEQVDAVVIQALDRAMDLLGKIADKDCEDAMTTDKPCGLCASCLARAAFRPKSLPVTEREWRREVFGDFPPAKPEGH